MSWPRTADTELPLGIKPTFRPESYRALSPMRSAQCLVARLAVHLGAWLVALCDRALDLLKCSEARAELIALLVPTITYCVDMPTTCWHVYANHRGHLAGVINMGFLPRRGYNMIQKEPECPLLMRSYQSKYGNFSWCLNEVHTC